jgi:hypothetical protein
MAQTTIKRTKRQKREGTFQDASVTAVGGLQGDARGTKKTASGAHDLRKPVDPNAAVKNPRESQAAFDARKGAGKPATGQFAAEQRDRETAAANLKAGTTEDKPFGERVIDKAGAIISSDKPLELLSQNPLDILGSKNAAGYLLAGVGSLALLAALPAVIAGGVVAGGVVAGGVRAYSTRLLASTAIGEATVAGSTIAVATNAKTIAQTTTWLGGIAASVGSPAFVAGAILPIVGSYPFTGFIREEALQTLGFATKMAIDSGDPALADAAIAEQEALLNPDLWAKIIAGVPFANVVAELNKFQQAARIKLAVDKKLINDMRLKQAGLSDDEIFAQNQQFQSVEGQALSDDWNAKRAISIQLEADAAAAGRQADADFWTKYREESAAFEQQQREISAQFWLDYQKAKFAQTSSLFSSSGVGGGGLNFGGIGGVV